MVEPDYQNWTDEKLRRKANQAWEMAGCARHDRDLADEKRRIEEARAYEQELRDRHA